MTLHLRAFTQQRELCDIDLEQSFELESRLDSTLLVRSPVERLKEINDMGLDKSFDENDLTSISLHVCRKIVKEEKFQGRFPRARVQVSIKTLNQNL